MNAGHYFERLYPFQDEVLARIRPLDTGFYLTGGTAASRGYLHHRFSDDLDLFVNDERLFPVWSGRILDAIQADGKAMVEVLQREERIVRLQAVSSAGLELKIDLINDVPARVGNTREDAVLGRLDSPENILANKVTAAIDRGEPKDLADIWGFCCRMELSLGQALENASSKAAGIFPADLARVLLSTSADDYELVRWISPPGAGEFVRSIHDLGEQLLIARV